MNAPFTGNTLPCGCPDIDPAAWDGTRHRWANRVLFRQPLRCLFGTPVAMPAALRCMQVELDRAGYIPESPQMLLYRLDRFSGEMLLSVCEPEAETPAGCLVLNDVYLVSAVYRGKPAGAGSVVKRLRAGTVREGMRIERTYLWPVTCRECAVERGGAVTVVLGILEGGA